MGFFLIGIVVLALGLLVLHQFANANIGDLAKLVHRWGGVLVILLAMFLAVTGRWFFAIPVAGFGYSMLRGRLPGLGGFPMGGTRSAGQTSSVTSRYLEMELDHDSGDMRGHILDGDFQGQELQSLSLGDLLDFMGEISADEESRSLLEAYMDRRFPGWRTEEGTNGEGAAGGAQARDTMTREEAFAILGLREGASAAQIRNAHRTLMKKLHPDQGGSTYFATKLNEARDLLL